MFIVAALTSLWIQFFIGPTYSDWTNRSLVMRCPNGVMPPSDKCQDLTPKPNIPPPPSGDAK